METGSLRVKVGSCLALKEFLQEDIKSAYDQSGSEMATLAPNWEIMEDLEEKGQHTTFYLVNEEDDPVGWACFFIYPHIHYKDDVFGNIHVLFLKPELRKTNALKVLVDSIVCSTPIS